MTRVLRLTTTEASSSTKPAMCGPGWTLPFCSGVWSRTSTFQFLVVEGDSLVFKNFFAVRVQQRLSRRLLTIFLPVEVFKVFAQDRVYLHNPHLQLVSMKMQMSLVKGFFGLFTGLNKVRSPPPVRVRGCPPGRAHGLQLMTRVLGLTTTKASSRTKLAMCGPGLPRILGWTLLVSLGYMFVVMAQYTGGTWTLSTRSGGRRGTAELGDPPPAQGGM